MLTGNLSLEDFDVGKAASNPEEAARTEKMIRKLRANMMPPPGVRRPAAGTLTALVETLESVVDEAAADNPNPGYRTFQRLNRYEYERAIDDLLGLRIDAGDYLPLDTMSANFDNIADVQLLSATLLDGYLRAATGGRPARRRQSERRPEAGHLLEVAGLLAVGPGGRRARTARAAGSRCCTTSPPTATTSSRWRSSTRPPAVCPARPSATSRSRSPSTASR